MEKRIVSTCNRALGLTGRRVVPTRSEAEGFEFRHPDFVEVPAIADVIDDM